MNTVPPHFSGDCLVYDAETDLHYSIEVIAELAGVNPHTVIHYQEQGFFRPSSRDEENAEMFDVEFLRQLRRIEHLRTTCEMNDSGLKLMFDLLHEIESLREESRQIRR